MALAIWKELRDTLNDSKMPMAVRVAAADGLGELGSSHSQETLLATLRDETAELEVRVAAVRALSRTCLLYTSPSPRD